jgi:hypothetical protein
MKIRLGKNENEYSQPAARLAYKTEEIQEITEAAWLLFCEGNKANRRSWCNDTMFYPLGSSRVHAGPF